MSILSEIGHDAEAAYKHLLHGSPDALKDIRAALGHADELLATLTTWAQYPGVPRVFPDAHDVAQRADELRHTLQGLAVKIDAAAQAAGKG